MTAPPSDLSHHFSYTAKNREASFTKSLYKYFLIPGIVNFAGGIYLSKENFYFSVTDDCLPFQAYHIRHTSPMIL